jgi:hypothetical protein
LLGAGLGTITLIWLLGMLHDGPSTVLAVAGLALGGAGAFAMAAGHSRAIAGASAGLLVLFALAGANAILADENSAFLRIKWSKGIPEGDALYESWNAYSRIRIIELSNAPGPPYGWAYSPTIPSDIVLRQKILS